MLPDLFKIASNWRLYTAVLSSIVIGRVDVVAECTKIRRVISQVQLVMDTSNSLQSKSIPACNLCLKEVKDEHKRYLVNGRGQFNVLSELKSLDFNVANTSRYICRVCLDKLKKRGGLITQVLNLELKRIHHEHSSNIHQLKDQEVTMFPP